MILLLRRKEKIYKFYDRKKKTYKIAYKYVDSYDKQGNDFKCLMPS